MDLDEEEFLFDEDEQEEDTFLCSETHIHPVIYGWEVDGTTCPDITIGGES